MRLLFILSIVLSFAGLSLTNAQHTYKTKDFKLQINKAGTISHMVDKARNINYAYASEKTYALQLKVDEKIIAPTACQLKGKNLQFTYPGEYTAIVKVESKATHIRFELLKLKNADKVEAIIWGPFKTTVSGIIGDFVGVVRNTDYAIGIQALNVKTTGGELVNAEGAVYSRGSTAVEQSYGSSLQAFCINHSKEKEIEVWNGFPKTKVIARDDFHLEGSAIALFGIDKQKALENIGQIEIAEGLPHIVVDGEWIKNSSKAGRPYIISNFGEETVDKMLDFTQQVGFYSLYQSHPFEHWGHFDLLPSLFPNGRAGVKACVEKAEARNIRLGVHTLTNFITPTDAFVTPIPHKGLTVFAATKIAGNISEDAKEITIENPEFYNKKTTLQTVRIGDELIRFAEVTEEAPYKLLGCKRGSFGTKASSHSKGASIARLLDHPYKTFYPDMDLQDEMIDNLVAFFNETGISHMDFDGHEGTYSTGFGDASKDHFADRFFKGVNHTVINGTSRSGHYYWHYNTYLNWGEPWYGGMKESQNTVRINNQAVLERNYQPNMLGWFWYNKATTVEEMEWMLARAAGWNAGYALVVNPKDIDINPNTSRVIEEIKVWEEAKNRKIFNESQRALLKAGENDFSLVKKSDDEFHLQYYKKFKFVHENIVLQPGQPNYTEWEFTNKHPKQGLYLQIGTVGDSGEASYISLEIDGYNTIELPVTLKAGYSCIYNGSDQLLVYDDKGRLKTKKAIDFRGIELSTGEHVIRISCDYSNTELEIKGMVKLKDKVDRIIL